METPLETTHRELEHLVGNIQRMLLNRPKSAPAYHTRELAEVLKNAKDLETFVRKATRNERNAGAAELVRGMERRAGLAE